MVSVKVNLLTFVPVLAFHIVMELGVSITAMRSRHESYTKTHTINEFCELTPMDRVVFEHKRLHIILHWCAAIVGPPEAWFQG